MTKLRALQPYLDQQLPNDWELIPLSQIIDLAYGEGLSDENRVAGNIPVFGSNGIVGYHNNSIVKGPAIIVGRKGSAGEVTWSDFDCFPIDTTFYVRPLTDDLDFRWLYYQLVFVDFKRLNAATGVPGLSRSDALDICIPFYNKTEQSKISEVLQQVDYAIEHIQNSIAQAQQLKKALMQHLLSGRLKPDGTWRTPDEFYIDDRVGKVPKDWCVYRMAELGKFYGGATPSTQQQSYWNGNIYWLVPSDISSFGDDEIIIQETADKITELGLASCSATMLPQGSVSMSSRATLGDCGILGKNMCTNQGFINIVCNEKIINTYLLFWIRQNKRYISRYAAGTTFLEIGRRQFKKLRLAIPEVDEQKKIIDLLTGVDNLLKGKREKISKLISLKKALMQNLLTGKIRVRVG
jgi:type I restriction enzyme S subunit